MAERAPARNSVQQARKSAAGKRPGSSLAVIHAALAESSLPKRRVDDGGTDVQKDSFPTVSEIFALNSRTAERLPTRPLFLSASASSVRVSPDPTPSSNARSGEISDSCYRNIVELFARRYIRTFDRDRLALEGAYMSEATFSCRLISSSHSPPPYYLAKCNTGTLQGPSSIVQTLSSFSQRILFVPEADFTLDVTIEVLQLPDTNYFMILSFDTVIEGAGVSVDMIFLLKDSTRLSGKLDRLRVLWTPFVVMSHQIILRS